MPQLSYMQELLGDREGLLATGQVGRESMWSLKAGSHVRRKRKRRSHVKPERKRNEIRTRISVSQDGGNLVSRVRVTLEQELGNKGSGNEIKDEKSFDEDNFREITII